MSPIDVLPRTTTRRLRRHVPVGFLRNQHQRQSSAVWVNDVHSQLNRTQVKTLLIPRTEVEVAAAIQAAVRAQMPICISGCRHAMGGQQFATDGVLLDMRQMSRVLSFDEERGLIEVQAGIQWPELIQTCLDVQPGDPAPWTIAQKQTGADTFTLGGSLSANVHGRGLTMKPLVNDIESFTLINAEGGSVTCSRSKNSELFRHAIGGYGLFGIITRVTLRLARRGKLQRVVEMVRADELIGKFNERIGDGCVYGDFQFSIDEESDDFLQLGVLSCYRTLADRRPVSAARHISGDDWLKLLHLAYTDRAEGFRRYTDYYLATNGQTYWSDIHQLSPYLPDYSARIRMLGNKTPRTSLMISELFVPRGSVAAFLRAAARLLRAVEVPVVYGTVRLIEQDDETFLPWARQSYACIIFNLLTEHNANGIERSADAFRELIDRAASFGGSFYLTYHKFATRGQVERCYPRFPEFLLQKSKYDPGDCFQSDWHRHYRSR